jgi:murein DD-endopeptidase MepM/ murein hydrolase activator NlpD
MQSVDGTLFSGDPLDNRSYYAYGKSVLAVADATVVTTRDGIPDNVPRHNGQFHAAVPISMETVAGNNITLDLGGGQFAHYIHLQPGSLRVKAGDRVRRGQVLARIGDSGDARGPHLHFQVSTSVSALASEGVPYVIDKYCVAKQAGGITEERRRELPLNDMHVQFCEAKSK